jgi:hypothetical protein
MGGDGWAWVSLSAYNKSIPAEELAAKLPGGKVEIRNNDIVSVEFSEARDELPLRELLDRLASYLRLHREQLLSIRHDVEFQVRIGWSPLRPQESLVVSSQLINALAELNVVVMLDGYG